MGSTLKWKLTVRGGSLSYKLRKILEGSTWHNLGKLTEAKIGKDDTPYFAALRDAGVEGAEEVLELIDRHGDIVIYLEN